MNEAIPRQPGLLGTAAEAFGFPTEAGPAACPPFGWLTPPALAGSQQLAPAKLKDTISIDETAAKAAVA
jgi:hypothetical protein